MAQSSRLTGDGHTGIGVGVGDAPGVAAGAMDGRVNKHAGRIYRVLAGLDDLAVDIDLDQVGCTDLAKMETVGVD